MSSSKLKFLSSKKNLRGLSTDMKKVPTVPYVKQKGHDRSEYTGFLNPLKNDKAVSSCNHHENSA